ncbi:hypothetical protein [Agathobaculum desmolans]|uniref:hypothetical protein n=1 Tax=Agathobaculum desmolans TaxID=39484 RepID=UPI00248D4EDC|nr:hypothetical protein [Agathobaculum desmolans]
MDSLKNLLCASLCLSEQIGASKEQQKRGRTRAFAQLVEKVFAPQRASNRKLQ